MKPKDAVFFRCLNPAFGFIKRMAKDGSWADVEFHGGLNYVTTKRVKITEIEPLNQVLNDHLRKQGRV